MLPTLSPLSHFVESDLTSELSPISSNDSDGETKRRRVLAFAQACASRWADAGYDLNRLENEYKTDYKYPEEGKSPRDHPWYRALEENINNITTCNVEDISAHCLIKTTRRFLSKRVAQDNRPSSEGKTMLLTEKAAREEKRRRDEWDKSILFLSVHGHLPNVVNRLSTLAKEHDPKAIATQIGETRQHQRPDLVKLTFTSPDPRNAFKDAVLKPRPGQLARLDGHRLEQKDGSRFHRDCSKMVSTELSVCNFGGTESELKGMFEKVSYVKLLSRNRSAFLGFDGEDDAMAAFDAGKDVVAADGCKITVLFVRPRQEHAKKQRWSRGATSSSSSPARAPMQPWGPGLVPPRSPMMPPISPWMPPRSPLVPPRSPMMPPRSPMMSPGFHSMSHGPMQPPRPSYTGPPNYPPPSMMSQQVGAISRGPVSYSAPQNSPYPPPPPSPRNENNNNNNYENKPLFVRARLGSGSSERKRSKNE